MTLTLTRRAYYRQPTAGRIGPRRPDALRQRVFAAIASQPGITRPELVALFADEKRESLLAAIKLLLHVDSTIRAEGWGPNRRYWVRA